MKPTELRIGNLVMYNGKVVKVEQITKHKIGYHTKPNETRMNYARLCEIEPIPITEELLLKIGFKKDRNGYFNYEEYDDELSIRFSENYTFIEYANLCFNPEDVTETNYGSSLEFPNTLHLHTLQNIWYLLTGKELEIKV
jgi:hypothetical protein